MDKASGTVLDFFNTVEDPRQRGKVVYRLDEILLIALAGCLAGADNFVEMAGWARWRLCARSGRLPGACRAAQRCRQRARPRHLRGVLRGLDRGDPARRLIAIDGKTSKRTPAPAGVHCTPCRPTRASSASCWPRRSASRTSAP